MIHPFLLAIFPILVLFAQNSTQVPYRHLLMPIILALGERFVVWLIFTGLLGNAQKAGLFATLGLVLFYTSGRLPQFVDSSLSRIELELGVHASRDSSRALLYLTAFVIFVAAGLLLASKVKHTGFWTKSPEPVHVRAGDFPGHRDCPDQASDHEHAASKRPQRR